MNDREWEALVKRMRPGPPAGFDAWRAKVDAIVCRKFGVSIDDLPDYDLVGDYEDGATPAKAAAAAIRNAKEG